MMTPKENFLELLKPNGQPDRQLCQYEALHMCLNDPINTYLRGNRKRGTVSKDRWGTTISFPADAPGPMPVTTDGLAVCPDITHWRETVHAPDIAACTEGWEACRAAARAACGEEKLLAGTGIFEQCHFLMGFEDTLTNLYEHPQEMHALIDYITTYRLLYVKLLIDNLRPDVIFSHDDWGTKDALFMKPEMWREFFKEPYRRFYGYIRSRGVIAIHHADSYLAPIVEDMAEIGIQVWQGVLPENDIPALQQKLHGRLVLMGGMGAAIDRTDAAPEEIYGYAMDTLRRCCPGGHYSPSITYGLPGAVYPHVDEYIDRAIADYNRALHVPRFDLPSVPRRVRAVAVRQAAGAAVENGDVLARLAAALEKGQQKKVLALCQEALEQGRTGGNAKTVGRACIGTVLGDMHDIGKNLVKIMLEGSGVEVIDLGVDVTPEQFVETAKRQHCGVIACSSLLTTTMGEMRRVVTLAREAGIRDQVKIFVGGAPISQSFCDEIGADVYTEDAAAAARAAVSALKG